MKTKTRFLFIALLLFAVIPSMSSAENRQTVMAIGPFRRNYYSQVDIAKIGYIGGLATDLATLIDTPVFEET